jgi:2-dehydropantoate 2-reductase
MQPIRRIAILGAGALGAAYASQFFKMDPQSVLFVADGERAARLKTDGVVVNGRHYAIPVVSPNDPAVPVDLVIVALKHQHLETALPDLRQVVGDNTLILSVMNGLDSERAISDLYGREKVLYAISIGIDAVREGNRTVYNSNGKIMFGEIDNHVMTERVRRVQEVFERTGIVYETPVDMQRTMWWKFMINVGINQASAVLRAPYGVFQRSADARALMASAMREVLTIAQKAQVNLDEDDLAQGLALPATLAPDGKTSMLQDIEAGRKTEVEMFAGKVIEFRQTYGIPTPVNQTLFHIIKTLEGSYLQ